MSVPASMMGPPPTGLAQLPPGPPGMGAMGGGDPTQALSMAASGLEQDVQQKQGIATTLLAQLAQLLADQASPEAVAAQSSPGPLLPPTAGSQGPAGL